MRKASVVAGMLTVVTSGSMLLGGTALAWHHHWWHDSDGGTGKGGTATNNCINIGAPILSGIGVAGAGEDNGASCVASANGSGGSGY